MSGTGQLHNRGLFIVFEGIDGSGKSTQSQLLCKYLCENGWNCTVTSFPDRKTLIGQLIDENLKNKIKIPAECFHLLFSANRWEKIDEIRNLLEKGTSVICDRYAYSGVAYSVGAEKLESRWCLASDKGLLKPDRVYNLLVDPKTCQNYRKDYGAEVYEKHEIAVQVEQAYKMFYSLDNWIRVSHSGICFSNTNLDSSFDICLERPNSNEIAKQIQDNLKSYINKYLVDIHIRLPLLDNLGETDSLW